MILLRTYFPLGAPFEEKKFVSLFEALLFHDPSGNATVLWDKYVAPSFSFETFSLARLSSDFGSEFVRKFPGTIEVIARTEGEEYPFWRYYPGGVSVYFGDTGGWILVHGEEWNTFLAAEYGSEAPSASSFVGGTFSLDSRLPSQV